MGTHVRTPEPPLPPHLLADPQFAAACASRRIGRVFQLVKARAGIYPADIARRTDLTTSRVTEIMTGGRTVAAMDVIERIADGLRIPGHMLGLADRPWQTPQPIEHGPARVPETWEVLDMLTRSTAGDATLLHLEAAVADAAFRYPASAPVETVPAMTRQLTAVHELLGRPQSLAARRRCVLILTALSGLLGLAHLDVGDPARSGAFFHLGQVAAAEAADDGLTAWLLTMQSIAEYAAGRTGHAAVLLGQADTLAAGATLRRRAWISANLGRALAAQRFGTPSLAALELAAHQLGDATAEIGGLDFFTAARLDGLAGTSHALLGDHDTAADLLMAALGRRDQGDLKGRAVLTFDLADCRIGQGDVDAACALAHDAMDIAEGSIVQPLLLRARDFQRSLAPWRTAGPVREFAARVRESGQQLARA